MLKGMESKILIIFSCIMIMIFLIWVSCKPHAVGPISPIEALIPSAQFISGRIIEEESKSGLDDVRISVGGNIVYSNENGDFDLTIELPAGAYQIKAEKENYVSVYRELIIGTIEINESFLVNLSMFNVKPPTSIPTSGGTIISTSDEGEYIATIPSGALSTEAEISITPVLGGGIPALAPEENDFILNAVNLLPSGLEFNTNITISIPITISLESISIESITAISYDYETNQFENLGAVGINPDTTAYVIEVSHFSTIIIRTGADAVKYSSQPYTDPVVNTGTIAGCTSDGVTHSETFSLSVSLTGGLSVGVATAQIGVTVGYSITRSGSCNRSSETDPEKEVTYKIQGTYYRFQIWSNLLQMWTEAGSIKKPSSVTFGCKDRGECHDQGG